MGVERKPRVEGPGPGRFWSSEHKFDEYRHWCREWLESVGEPTNGHSAVAVPAELMRELLDALDTYEACHVRPYRQAVEDISKICRRIDYDNHRPMG